MGNPKELPWNSFIISAGHSLFDPGAVASVPRSHTLSGSTGDPTASPQVVTESALNILYRDSLVDHLRNIHQKQVITPVDTLSLRQTIEFAKAFPGGLAVELHFNAASNESAEGIEVFYHGGNKRCQALAKQLCSVISEEFSQKNRGAKCSEKSARGRLGFVDDLKDAILIEVGFMSNEQELLKFLSEDIRHSWVKVVGDILVIS